MDIVQKLDNPNRVSSNMVQLWASVNTENSDSIKTITFVTSCVITVTEPYTTDLIL